MGPIGRASFCLPFLAQFLEDIKVISCQQNIYDKRLLLFYDVRYFTTSPWVTYYHGVIGVEPPVWGLGAKLTTASQEKIC
jgi:hypothetical protein